MESVMCNAGLEPKLTEPSEVELVAAAQAGDRSAFDVLADRYRAGLIAVGLDLAGRFEVAQDLAQTALCRAWEHIRELQDGRAFGPWLRTIAVNCYRMWLRRPGQDDVPLEQAETAQRGADQFDEAFRREIERALAFGLRALPRQNRLALLMRVLGDASYQEIAHFLGVPESTVAGRIYRARRQLQARLEWLLEDD